MGLLDDAIREHLDLKRRRGADPSEIERAERDALGPVRRGPEGSDEVDLNHDALPDDDLGYEEDTAYEQEGPFEEPHELHEPPDFQAPAYEPEEPRAYEEPHTYEEPRAYDEPQDIGGRAPTEPPTPRPVSEHALDQETEAWDSLEPDAPHLVDAPHAPHPAEAPHPADSHAAKEPGEVADELELDDEASAQAPREAYAPPPPPAPAPAEPPEPEPPVGDPHATQRYAAEPATPEPHPAEPHGDVLGGETAEFDMELEEIEGEEDVLEETPEFLQDTPDHDRLWFEQRPPKDFDFDE